ASLHAGTEVPRLGPPAPTGLGGLGHDSRAGAEGAADGRSPGCGQGHRPEPRDPPLGSRALAPRHRRRCAGWKERHRHGEEGLMADKEKDRKLATAPAGPAPVIKADGSSDGSVGLPAAIVSPAKRRGVLFQALLASLANKRQGTSATKNRSRVSGGGAKPWRQKGTGRARQGSTRSPQWRHGGVVFGPNGRRYNQRMPAKMRHAAFAQALAAHAATGHMLVVDELRFDGDQPRARDVVDWLARVGQTGRAVLVTAQTNERVGRATATLKEFEIRTPGTLRLADVLRAETV